LKIKKKALRCVEEVLTSFHQNFDSAVNQNTLFHGESLFVIASSNSESVTLELLAQHIPINIGAHSPVIEVATTKYHVIFENSLT